MSQKSSVAQGAEIVSRALMSDNAHRAFDGEPIVDTLSRIPANIPLLRSYFRKVHAVRVCYALSTWRNIKRFVKIGLRLGGVQVREGRNRLPLPQPWQVILDAATPRQQMVLHPFAQWNWANGRLPGDVDQAVFEAYEAYLEGFDGRERRRRCYLTVCNAWNAAAEVVPGWPLLRVAVKKRHDHYILDWKQFAPSFEKDVDAALNKALHPDPFDERRRKRINARTARHQRYQLRRVASALCAQTGRDPNTITSVADLVHPTAAREALRYLMQRSHQRQIARDRLVSPSKK